MAVALTDGQIKLLKGKNFAHVATVNKDGSPQLTPVWVDYDGKHVIINSEEKRLKVRNLKRNPEIAVEVLDPQNPYQYMQVRGRVVEITSTGGAEGIDALAKKYLGQDKYPYNQPGDVRVVIRVEPGKVSGGVQ
jgi:PPOX class probable F420-dependent enzyme